MAQGLQRGHMGASVAIQGFSGSRAFASQKVALRGLTLAFCWLPLYRGLEGRRRAPSGRGHGGDVVIQGFSGGRSSSGSSSSVVVPVGLALAREALTTD